MLHDLLLITHVVGLPPMIGWGTGAPATALILPSGTGLLAVTVYPSFETPSLIARTLLLVLLAAYGVAMSQAYCVPRSRWAATVVKGDRGGRCGGAMFGTLMPHRGEEDRC